jgi:hypothetical protein
MYEWGDKITLVRCLFIQSNLWTPTRLWCFSTRQPRLSDIMRENTNPFNPEFIQHKHSPKWITMQNTIYRPRWTSVPTDHREPNFEAMNISMLLLIKPRDPSQPKLHYKHNFKNQPFHEQHNEIYAAFKGDWRFSCCSYSKTSNPRFSLLWKNGICDSWP